MSTATRRPGPVNGDSSQEGVASRTPARSVRRAALVAATIALVAGLAGLDVRATYGAQTTADEPHYLLTAMSLAEDGNLDIADELAQRRWEVFHEANLPLQERVLDDGRMLSPHDPLLPMVVAPAMALGGWRAVKVALALVAAATAAAAVTLGVRRLGVRPAWATGVIAVAFASWPLSGHATQVYPEVAAALATTVGLYAATSARPRPGTVVVAAAAVVALPWLAVKYVPVAAAVAAVTLWRLWERDRRLTLATAAGLALAGTAYLVAHQVVWTGWTVYASADHFVERGEFSVVGFDPNLPGRARRLVGLLLGRDFGLAAWQPAWLLVAAGVAAALRWSRTHREVVAVITVGWLNATFVALTMQGWWVPGRQVVVILPLLALLVARWLQDAGRAWHVAAGGLAAVGLVTTAWLVVDGLAGRITWVVDFMQVGDPLFQLRYGVLPDYLDVSTATWVAQSVGILALVGLAAVGWHHAGRRPRAG